MTPMMPRTRLFAKARRMHRATPMMPRTGMFTKARCRHRATQALSVNQRRSLAWLSTAACQHEGNFVVSLVRPIDTRPGAVPAEVQSELGGADTKARQGRHACRPSRSVTR